MTKIRSEKTGFWLGLLFILACSFIVFFYRYGEPKGPVWDEPYHIASAEKYLNKVMFMEVHPPLGKLFIALGEKMFNPNASLDKSNFLSTDYIDTFPDGYSFIGVRFFPTLFSALSAAILFLIFFVISKRPFLSFVSSSFYIFDNAIVSHFRGAMLDGIQLFFILAAILYFIYTYKTSKTIKSFQYLILGVLSGLAIATKVTALILILLLPALFLAKERIIFSNKCLNSFLIKSLFFSGGIIITFSSVFFIHFYLGQRVINGNYYGATKSYEASMFNNKELDYSLFPNALRDNIRYSKQYNNNVPKLNLNDPKENGSKPLGWPLGIKSINYRWDKVGNKVSYIYLQGNPIVWLAGLFGVLFSLIFTIANTLLRSKIKNGATFYFMSLFVTLYLAYMGGILTIDRVMYLYHYLVPLTFSLILLFLVFSYLLSKKENNRSLPFFLVLLQLIVLSGFLFFSPLTYGSPLDANQFSYREWLSFWHLKSIR